MNERHSRGWTWILAALLLVAVIALVKWQRSLPEGSFFASALWGIGARILLVAVSLAGWFWTQSLIGSRGDPGGKLGDRLHDITEPWNDWLRNHGRTTDGILIGSSVFIDLFGLFLIGTAVFGQTLRPFLALLMLFAFRQVCQALCALPVPPKMIWRNPGFPSLLVTYGVSNDFFISGHTAIAVLGAIEVCRHLPVGWGVAAVVVAALEACTVIILRAHYTLDVFGAIVAAFCAAGLASHVCLAMGL